MDKALNPTKKDVIDEVPEGYTSISEIKFSDEVSRRTAVEDPYIELEDVHFKIDGRDVIEFLLDGIGGKVILHLDQGTMNDLGTLLFNVLKHFNIDKVRPTRPGLSRLVGILISNALTSMPIEMEDEGEVECMAKHLNIISRG